MRRAVMSWPSHLGSSVARAVAFAVAAAPTTALAWPVVAAPETAAQPPAPAEPAAPAPAEPAAADPPASPAAPEADAKADEKPKDKEKEKEEKEGEEEASSDGIDAKLAFHGAMEVYYAYNFNRPSNDYTNWRWYDHRHNMLGLQGLWFAPEWQVGPVTGHFQLQLGVLAELFWASERSIEEDVLWRLLQEATMEWKTPWKRLSLEGGIFNVPFGPEWNLAYKNWNWSTSNLFALMPYQIAGARLNLDLGKGWITRLGVYNGWDRIVKDNNKQKAMMLAVEWTDPDDEENYFVAEWMVGNERDTDDPRGRAPRHVFDVYGQWHILRPLTLRAHTFSGVDAQRGRYDGWLGLAFFAKVDLHKWFSIAGRGDYVHTFAATENLFHTDVLADPKTSTKLGSGTITFDFHPPGNISLRLEARHDRASFPLFYRGNVPLSDPMDPQSWIPTARTQTTLLAGMTAWF